MSAPASPPVLLRPRPRTHPSVNLILLPLLPPPVVGRPLPSEIWARILRHTGTHDSNPRALRDGQSARFRLLLVCKAFKEVVLPLLYAKPYIPTFHAFVALCERIIEGDMKWDNLRRIEYSTPGRWVGHMDLSLLADLTSHEHLRFDRVITQTLATVPLLKTLIFHPGVVLTRQATQALGDSQVSWSLQRLCGVHISTHILRSEALISALRSCHNLEQLDLTGSGLDADSEFADPEVVFAPVQLHLTRLHSLSVIQVPMSPVLCALAQADLPSLRNLTISPFCDLEDSDAVKVLTAHAERLAALTLAPGQTWPATRTQIPSDILLICPNLRYLSIPPGSSSLELEAPPSDAPPSKLAVLSIPRPDMEFLQRIVEPLLTSLREVRIRDVRYMSRGMGAGAATAGSSAAMLEWRRRLSRRKVAVLDAQGRPGP